MNKQQGPDFTHSTPVSCDNCGGYFFEQVILQRKFPAAYFGAMEDIFTDIDVLRCEKCETISTRGLDPTFLKALKRDNIIQDPKTVTKKTNNKASDFSL